MIGQFVRWEKTLEINQVGCGVTCYPSTIGLIGKEVTAVGYIGTHGYDQYKSDGKILPIPISSEDFRSTNSSTSGFSGGPIMLKSNNNIVGVVHGTDGNNNCWGVRITEDMIALIKELNGN